MLLFSTLTELNGPSNGKRDWSYIYWDVEKTIQCLSVWFKFCFILSVNLEKYLHFIELIQIESK